jgi:phospholipase/carboxylesterase
MTQPSKFTGVTRVTLERAFTLHLPASPPPPAGFPLLVALHGYGETGDILSRRLEEPADAPYARLFPDAPFPVEVREPAGTRVGASWYQYTGDQPAFLAALEFAEAYLRDVVATAVGDRPVDPGRTVLLGYSQGGYLAGVAAFRNRTRYRGLVGVACRIKTESLEGEIAGARAYPVLLIHGARDRHTPVERQRDAHDVLRRAGVDATLHVHEAGHGFRPDLAPLIDAFVRRVLWP